MSVTPELFEMQYTFVASYPSINKGELIYLRILSYRATCITSLMLVSMPHIYFPGLWWSVAALTLGRLIVLWNWVALRLPLTPSPPFVRHVSPPHSSGQMKTTRTGKHRVKKRCLCYRTRTLC